MLGRLVPILAFTLSAGAFAPCIQAAQPLGCLIEAQRSADIGSPVVGIIETIPVDRGDYVKKGQALVTLKAQPERAALNVAKIRQEAEGELRAAEAAAAFAEQHLKRNEELFQRNYISRHALDQARFDNEAARQKLAQARDNRKAAAGELDYSRAQLNQRVIVAPFDGVVTERYMVPGERVEEKPIVRLAQIDPLRVEVVAPISLYGQIKIGDIAKVQPELPGTGPANAQVTRIDKVIDPASNTFRALLRLDNSALTLPAGLRCTVALNQTVNQTTPTKTGETATSSAPTAAPVVNKTNEATSSSTGHQAVSKQLQSWLAAWQKKDAQSYLAFYADDFKPPRALMRDDWVKERRQRLERSDPIELRIENLQLIGDAAEYLRATFVQHYRSGSYSETSNKELTWRKHRAGWLIVQERQLQ